MSSTIFTEASWLSMAENVGYGQLPIPDPKDDQVQALVVKWIELDEHDRISAGQAVAECQRFTLLAYSERMASFAVREKSINLVYLGLVALGIDGWRNDWRDNAVLLSLHYDALTKLGVEPKLIFEKAAKLMSTKVKASFQGFLRRSDEDKSLDAMGYEEGQDVDGFRYNRTW